MRARPTRGAPDRLVAAEHHQRREPVLPRPLGVRQTQYSSECFDGQKRHDPLARHVVPEVGHQVAQVVFFLRADGAVGQEDIGALPRQPLDGVIGVDPRVHALGGGKLRARRPQFGREHRAAGSEGGQQIH